MKEYTYFGNLQEDLKKANKKFDYKYFFKKMGFQFLGLITFCSLFYFTGIINNVLVFCVSYLSSASTLSFLSERSKAKHNSKLASIKVANLYEEIFDNDDCLSIEKMKKCIVIEKKQKIIEDTDTLNVVLSDEEKIVNYFYLLSPEDKIHVLRQIKSELQYINPEIYLLEDHDLKIENIDIPEDVMSKLKKKTVK